MTPVSASALAIAARAASSREVACVERDRRHAGPAGGERDPLVQLDELGQRQQRVAGIALHLGRAGLVAEDERVRRRAVDETERHPRVGGMRDRALALDEEQLATALVPLDDEPLGRAGDEVRDDGVDGDPPARDRDPGLPGRDEARRQPARSRCPVELERHRHLPDRAVRADGEDVPRRLLEVGARGDVQVRGRAAQVAELDAVARRERAQLLVVAQELVQAVLDVETARDDRLQQLAPRGREAPARGGDADERRRRLVAEGLLDRADDRDAALGLPRSGRVEDRDDGSLAVGEDAARGLAVVRVAGEALGEDQQSLRRARHRVPVSRTAPARRR